MNCRRQKLMSSVVLALIFNSPALATDSSISAERSQNDWNQRYDYEFDLSPDYVPDINWVDQVTMTRVPRGSLYRHYTGPTRFMLKLARNQVRRFAREHYDHSPEPHKLRMSISGGPVHQWWTREWYDSLPSDKGGAPRVPYIHTYGRDISWKFGPITLSNTFKVKIDYVAAFRLNADPQPPSVEADPIKPPKASSIAIDVHPDRQPFTSTTVKFKVRPNVRVGLPRLDKGWWSFLRKVALRVDLIVFIRGRPIIQGDAELSYSPRKGFALKIGITLGIW